MYTIKRAGGEPNEKDMQAMSAGMLAYHAEHGHPREEYTFSLFLHDNNGKPMGGMICKTLWERMYIRTLWVDVSMRRKGWGTKLMEMAEKEAIKRGCTHAYTDTTSYQAPEFYQKLGYTEFAKMEDYPPGSALHYFIKKLV